MKIRSSATFALVVLGLVASACTIQAGQQSSPATGAPLSAGSTAPSTDEPVAQVVSQTLPAVVNVTTDILTPQGQTGEGVGTGFIVRSDGIFVTNCHVVEGGTKITVSTSASTPQKYDARVIAGDCEHDLAALKSSGYGMPTFSLG